MSYEVDIYKEVDKLKKSLDKLTDVAYTITDVIPNIVIDECDDREPILDKLEEVIKDIELWIQEFCVGYVYEEEDWRVKDRYEMVKDCPFLELKAGDIYNGGLPERKEVLVERGIIRLVN